MSSIFLLRIRRAELLELKEKLSIMGEDVSGIAKELHIVEQDINHFESLKENKLEHRNSIDDIMRKGIEAGYPEDMLKKLYNLVTRIHYRDPRSEVEATFNDIVNILKDK